MEYDNKLPCHLIDNYEWFIQEEPENDHYFLSKKGEDLTFENIIADWNNYGDSSIYDIKAPDGKFDSYNYRDKDAVGGNILEIIENKVVEIYKETEIIKTIEKKFVEENNKSQKEEDLNENTMNYYDNTLPGTNISIKELYDSILYRCVTLNDETLFFTRPEIAEDAKRDEHEWYFVSGRALLMEQHPPFVKLFNMLGIFEESQFRDLTLEFLEKQYSSNIDDKNIKIGENEMKSIVPILPNSEQYQGNLYWQQEEGVYTLVSNETHEELAVVDISSGIPIGVYRTPYSNYGGPASPGYSETHIPLHIRERSVTGVLNYVLHKINHDFVKNALLWDFSIEDVLKTQNPDVHEVLKDRGYTWALGNNNESAALYDSMGNLKFTVRVSGEDGLIRYADYRQKDLHQFVLNATDPGVANGLEDKLQALSQAVSFAEYTVFNTPELNATYSRVVAENKIHYKGSDKMTIANKKDIQQAGNESLGIVEKITSSEENLVSYLSAVGRHGINGISLRNSLKVWSQKPDAKLLLSYEDWRKYGRQVQKGAEGVVIHREDNFPRSDFARLSHSLKDNNLEGIIPQGFSSVALYDVSDTSAKDRIWIKQENDLIISDGKVRNKYGFLPHEMVLSKDGTILRNNRDEVCIKNSPERQNRLLEDFNMSVEQDFFIEGRQDLAKAFSALVDRAQLRYNANIIEVNPEELDFDNSKTNVSDLAIRQMGEAREVDVFVNKEASLENKYFGVLFELQYMDQQKLLQLSSGSQMDRDVAKAHAAAISYGICANLGFSPEDKSISTMVEHFNTLDVKDKGATLSHMSACIVSECHHINNEMKIKNLSLEGANRDKLMLLESGKIEKITEYALAVYAHNLKGFTKSDTELAQIINTCRNSPDIKKMAAPVYESNKERLESVKDIPKSLSSLQSARSRLSQDYHNGNLQTACKAARDWNATLRQTKEQLNEFAKTHYTQEYNAFKEDNKTFLDNNLANSGLSSLQKSYLEKSNYISNNSSLLLNENKDSFIGECVIRANNLEKSASSTNTFVEVNYCEQVFTEPILETGGIYHPKMVDKKLKEAEANIIKAQKASSGKGEKFGYATCSVTVFTPNKEGTALNSVTMEIPLGSSEPGQIKGLVERIQDLNGNNPIKENILTNVETSLSDRSYAQKVYTPERDGPESTECIGQKLDKTLEKDIEHDKIAAQAERQTEITQGNEEVDYGEQ